MKPIVPLNEVSGNVLWLDARFRLNNPPEAKELFLKEHIPGAQFVDLDTELSGEKNGRNGRHPLPTRESLVKLYSRLGIEEETHVVIYDDLDHAGAARAWALLQWMGHEKVQVLDGGLAAWKRAGNPVESGEVLEKWPKKFVERPSLLRFFSKEEILGQELVDARAPERYRGEVEPLDKKAGHIPGAKNLFYKNLLSEEGIFLPVAELKKVFSPFQKPTFYCGSGVTGAVLLLVAKQIGMDASLYPGSWSEWSQDSESAVETK